MKVGIVDFGLSNLFSVTQACRNLNIEMVCTNDASQLAKSDALILPGVGAFGEAMRALQEQNLDRFLKDWVHSDKRLLGICLGMQLLFSESEEFGQHGGLNLLPGKVRRFPDKDEGGHLVKIPAVGWNQIRPPAEQNLRWRGTMMENLNPTATDAYFVHSYYCQPDSRLVILAESEYAGLTYCSAVSWGNVSAVQFHPEKSGRDGKIMLENWIRQAQ